MADCNHDRLTFDHRFTGRPGQAERMYQLEGRCADCGAPIVFVPAPSLSLDERNFQIPFRMGPPDPLRLVHRIGKPQEPMLIGGQRKAMN